MDGFGWNGRWLTELLLWSYRLVGWADWGDAGHVKEGFRGEVEKLDGFGLVC